MNIIVSFAQIADQGHINVVSQNISALNQLADGKDDFSAAFTVEVPADKDELDLV